MKKLIYIFLLTVYFFLSVGFTLATHFCKGKVSSVSFLHIAEDEHHNCACQTDCCTKCDGHCCHDELKTIKIEDFHTFQKTFESKKITSVEVFLPEQILYNFQTFSELQFTSKSPPLFKDPPSFILNKSLLI